MSACRATPALAVGADCERVAFATASGQLEPSRSPTHGARQVDVHRTSWLHPHRQRRDRLDGFEHPARNTSRHHRLGAAAATFPASTPHPPIRNGISGNHRRVRPSARSTVDVLLVERLGALACPGSLAACLSLVRIRGHRGQRLNPDWGPSRRGRLRGVVTGFRCRSVSRSSPPSGVRSGGSSRPRTPSGVA